MKILKLKRIAIIVVFFCTLSINAQSFIKNTGKATDIAISSKDGSVYVVGTSKNVFKYDFRSKKFKPFGKQSKNIKSITVHPNGTVYMVSTTNEVYRDYKGYWNKITGIKTNEINIDKNGNIRALNLSGKLYNLYKGQWQEKLLINRGTTGFNQIIGQDSKTLFARFKDNAFKIYKNGKWQTLNGNPLKITIDDKTGDLYAVGRNKGIYKWNKTTKKWVLLNGTRKDFKDIAVHNGKIWAVATNKSIYEYGKYVIPLVKKAKDYSGTYRVTINKLGSDKGYKYYGTIGVYLESKTLSGNVKIQPKDKKPNRVLDISKTESRKVLGKGFKVDKYLNNNYKNDLIEASLNIDVMREFILQGEAANSNATFDIQVNLTNDGFGGIDVGKWQRVKMNVKDLILNKEYFYAHGSSLSIICFKIEKL